MGLGRTPYRSMIPTGTAGRRSPQAAGDRLRAELAALLSGGSRRAVEIAVIPKRTYTYYGVERAARAPRIAPLGRASGDPTEGLRLTLVARTRYLQGLQTQPAGKAAGGGETQN